MRYDHIFDAAALEFAIINALFRNSVSGFGFAVLAEGNSFGTFYITVIPKEELSECDAEEIGYLTGYGYAICDDLSQVQRYAHDYFE